MVDIPISNYTPPTHTHTNLIHSVPQSREVLHMYLSFFAMMGKALKNYTCSFHIRLDGISKLKEHGFGFLEKGIDCTEVLVSQLLEIGQPML